MANQVFTDQANILLSHIFEDRIWVVFTRDNSLQGFFVQNQDNVLPEFCSLLDPVFP
jgi:hypothetical protein